VFDEVGRHDRMIVRGGPGGAEKWEPSRRGSILPRRCETKVGEDRGGSNEGGYKWF
jgi:hypothetical protein